MKKSAADLDLTYIFNQHKKWLAGDSNKRAVFDGYFLKDIDFSHICLDGASFQYACIENCKFYRTNLDNTSFMGASIKQCDFTEARTYNVNIKKARISKITGIIDNRKKTNYFKTTALLKEQDKARREVIENLKQQKEVESKEI